MSDFIFLGSKITADGDYNHEIKRCLLLGRKAMTNLDIILKSRDITLLTKFHLVKAIVFPVVMYRCEKWTIRKVERRRMNAFKLWCWRRLFESPLDSTELKLVNPKGYQPWIFISTLNIYWKVWCWSWSSCTLATWCEELTHWKRLWCWERLKAWEEGDDGGWDGWMASPTQWTWVWANSGR